MSATTDIGAGSRAAHGRALAVFPGGVTRATIQGDPVPRYLRRGEGCWIEDLDGGRLLDCQGNFTTLIHGHAFPPVVRALTEQLADGTCFANPTSAELGLAELLCARVPGLERLRFVSTGTEAVMFAIKAARALTGRQGVAKVEGAYHGAYDWTEAGQASRPDDWGSPEEPAATLRHAGTAGIVAAQSLVLRLNDAEGAARLIARHADRLACVILDVMPARAGLIPASPAFLEAVSETARRHGILVISDEVLTFRLGHAGASARHGLRPDLFAFGKIIGGGLPIGAIGGSAALMRVFGGEGPPGVAQGGTFAANPLSMRAGAVTLQHLDTAAFARLEAMGDALRAAFRRSIARHDAEWSVTGDASLLRLHARRAPPTEYREALPIGAAPGRLAALTRRFADHGIAWQAEGPACLSTAMGDAEIVRIADAFDAHLAAA